MRFDCTMGLLWSLRRLRLALVWTAFIISRWLRMPITSSGWMGCWCIMLTEEYVNLAEKEQKKLRNTHIQGKRNPNHQKTHQRIKERSIKNNKSIGTQKHILVQLIQNHIIITGIKVTKEITTTFTIQIDFDFFDT